MSSVSLEDRAAIGDAILAFYHLVDSGQASRTAATFTEDARLTFGPGSPRPGTIEGAAIPAAMAAREADTSAFTRHGVSNIALSGDGVQIGARYLLTLYRSDDDSRSTIPAFVADVEETWQRRPEGWRMAERTILPAFAR